MDDKPGFKRDLAHAGVISAIGIGTHQLVNKALIKMNKPLVGGISMAASGIAGLAGDYAALHTNRKIDDKLMPKQASENKYLEKISANRLGMLSGLLAGGKAGAEMSKTEDKKHGSSAGLLTGGMVGHGVDKMTGTRFADAAKKQFAKGMQTRSPSKIMAGLNIAKVGLIAPALTAWPLATVAGYGSGKITNKLEKKAERYTVDVPHDLRSGDYSSFRNITLSKQEFDKFNKTSTNNAVKARFPTGLLGGAVGAAVGHTIGKAKHLDNKYLALVGASAGAGLGLLSGKAHGKHKAFSDLNYKHPDSL